MIFFAWLAAIAAALYLYIQQKYTYFKRRGVQHIPPVPLLGNMGPVLRKKQQLGESIMELYKKFPKDRFVGRYELTNPMVVIRDLELVKKITIKDFEYFMDHGVSSETDPLFGRTLFTLKGEEWKDMRSMMSPAFTSAKIKNMVPFMTEVGDQMMTALNKQLKESGKGYIDVDCHALATRFANDVIASCAFGLQVDSYTDPDNKFYKMGYVVNNFTFPQMLIFMGHSAFPFLMKLFGITIFTEETRNFFTEIVTGTMKEREEHNILRPDMIHLLMEGKKGRLTHEEISGKDADAGFATVEESEVGKRKVNRAWSDTDLTAQALVFFLAGYKTVSTVMSFLLYELAFNPDVQDKLVREIREQEKTGTFDYSAIQKMTYMDMVVSELLRRWPPAVVMDRLCVNDYNLGKPNDKATQDYIIKKGEILTVPVMAIHHNPEYFPDPLKYDPERFSDENRHKINPMTFIPFGAGPRNCIGSRFALCEVKVMTYRLLLHMEVSPCEKTPFPPKLRADSFNLMLEGGHHLKMTPRK